jgi:hypothetical protein
VKVLQFLKILLPTSQMGLSPGIRKFRERMYLTDSAVWIKAGLSPGLGKFRERVYLTDSTVWIKAGLPPGIRVDSVSTIGKKRLKNHIV